MSDCNVSRKLGTISSAKRVYRNCSCACLSHVTHTSESCPRYNRAVSHCNIRVEHGNNVIGHARVQRPLLRMIESCQIHSRVMSQLRMSRVFVAISARKMKASATDYNRLQQTTADCNRLLQTATDCNTPGKFAQFSRDARQWCRHLQHTATHLNTLQHTATHCNTHPGNLHHLLALCSNDVGICQCRRHDYNTTESHCTILQHTATHTSENCTIFPRCVAKISASANTAPLRPLQNNCNTLQHTATQHNFNTAQYTATHCNTHPGSLHHFLKMCTNHVWICQRMITTHLEKFVQISKACSCV